MMLRAIRAKNGTRTRDPDLGKVVLYQLSYFRKISNLVGVAVEGVAKDLIQKINVLKNQGLEL